MEILVKSEYQDMYRVKDGVLLVINKFKPIKSVGSICDINGKNSTTYKNGCQSQLKRLTKQYVLKETSYRPEIILPKDTVLYSSTPVVLVPKNEWEYQVKTTGNLFKGNKETFENLLESILQVITED